MIFWTSCRVLARKNWATALGASWTTFWNRVPSSESASLGTRLTTRNRTSRVARGLVVTGDVGRRRANGIIVLCVRKDGHSRFCKVESIVVAAHERRQLILSDLNRNRGVPKMEIPFSVFSRWQTGQVELQVRMKHA
jgi:hypothetical protein